MKRLYYILSVCILLCVGPKASAQAQNVIAGTVTTEGGKPLNSATVFISGSQRITMCDETGHFKLGDIEDGSYQLTVTMVGYSPYAENVVVQGKSVTLDIRLKHKQIMLDQVNIGGKDDWDVHFKKFREAFLGDTKNAQACVIVNPKVINFSTKKGLLLADADDFLIIENPKLGYRIKYLLKDFGYNTKTQLTLYSGETSFEPMKGTPKMQKSWDKNRLEAYRGSFMHFLRSVYQNTVLKEGFIINGIYRNYYSTNLVYPVLLIDQRPVRFDTLANVIDTSFISFKFKPLMFTYDPRKAKYSKTNMGYTVMKEVKIDDKTTIIRLFTKEAVIDRQGAHRDFRDFLIEGNLAKYRVGDQLPFEYQPPAKK
jgi:hypothetical protein